MILCFDWHPNGVLMAAGSRDMKCGVIPACIKKVDEKLARPPRGQIDAFMSDDV